MLPHCCADTYYNAISMRPTCCSLCHQTKQMCAHPKSIITWSTCFPARKKSKVGLNLRCCGHTRADVYKRAWSKGGLLKCELHCEGQVERACWPALNVCHDGLVSHPPALTHLLWSVDCSCCPPGDNKAVLPLGQAQLQPLG